MDIVEQVSTLYMYVPTEPVIDSPHVECVDTKQQEIDELCKKYDALEKQLSEYKIIVEERFRNIELILESLKK
jgi:hypothetical protein